MSRRRPQPAGALVALAITVAAPALGGCPRGDGEERAAAAPRCAQCGMRVDLAPEFRAGAVDGQGEPVHFDAPKCLFRWLASDAGAGARDAWAMDWYGQARQPVEALRFVVGSDVVGPMGHDLVPVLGDEAARKFLRDHDGDRVVTAGDVDAALLRGLDAPRD